MIYALILRFIVFFYWIIFSFIENNHIGSVIKQSELDETEDMEDDDHDSSEDVFGVTTVVPLDFKQVLNLLYIIQRNDNVKNLMAISF